MKCLWNMFLGMQLTICQYWLRLWLGAEWWNRMGGLPTLFAPVRRIQIHRIRLFSIHRMRLFRSSIDLWAFVSTQTSNSLQKQLNKHWNASWNPMRYSLHGTLMRNPLWTLRCLLTRFIFTPYRDFYNNRANIKTELILFCYNSYNCLFCAPFKSLLKSVP